MECLGIRDLAFVQNPAYAMDSICSASVFSESEVNGLLMCIRTIRHSKLNEGGVEFVKGVKKRDWPIISEVSNVPLFGNRYHPTLQDLFIQDFLSPP